MTEQKYLVTVKAEGEVRDAEGNLISTIPIEDTVEVDEEQARRIQAHLDAQEQQP